MSTRHYDAIVGARQAADAGPSEIAPIVMWSYLVGTIKEYDKLLAEHALAAASGEDPK